MSSSVFWQKPSNMQYTDLAIYFDEHFSSDDRDDLMCYRCMYQIYYMLACKRHFFKRFKEYDDYAIYTTNIIYMRFLKKLRSGGKYKSLLNYAKSTAYPFKVLYQNETYKNITEEGDKRGAKLAKAVNEMAENSIRAQYSEGALSEVLDEFRYVPILLNKELVQSPYKNDLVMRRRIYNSVMISLIKGFTLTHEAKQKLHDAKNQKAEMKVIYSNLSNAKYDKVTLWRLSSDMEDYVTLLRNKVRSHLTEQVGEIQQSFEIDDATMNSIINSSWETINHVNNNASEDA